MTARFHLWFKEHTNSFNWTVHSSLFDLSGPLLCLLSLSWFIRFSFCLRPACVLPSLGQPVILCLPSTCKWFAFLGTAGETVVICLFSTCKCFAFLGAAGETVVLRLSSTCKCFAFLEAAEETVVLCLSSTCNCFALLGAAGESFTLYIPLVLRYTWCHNYCLCSCSVWCIMIAQNVESDCIGFWSLSFHLYWAKGIT